MPRIPSWVEILNAAIDSALTDLHVSLPGRVVAYNAATQTADVQPTVKQPKRNLDGSVAYLDLPTIPAVPVAWPSGGGFTVALPLSPGDPVLLVFSETPMGEYLLTGEDADPVDTRRHSLGYPVAFPGGAKPDAKAFPDAPIDGVLVGKSGSDQQVKIDSAFISLGRGATDFVALASKVDSALSSIQAKYDVHTHASFVAPPSTLLVSFPPVAATLVKAK